jgi:hypothetical protein
VPFYNFFANKKAESTKIRRFLRDFIGRKCFSWTSYQKNDEENLKSAFFAKVYHAPVKQLGPETADSG